MVYGVPAGLAALGGGLASGRGANPFNSVFGSVQSTAPRDDSFDKVAQVMQLEQQLSGARAAQQQRQQEQAAALAQQGQAEELRGQIPENLRELFDVDQETAIARAFPQAPDPGEGFRVVGNQLFDLRSGQPQLAATAPRQPAKEGLKQVLDPETGMARYVRESDAVGQIAPTRQGITIDKDGNIQIGGPATALGKKAQGTLEEGLINANTALDRMKSVGASYNPEFSTYQGATKAEAFRQAEKIGAPISAERKEYLKGFTVWRQNVGNNMSRYVKEMSGTAASDGERKDLAKQLPNANDSETEFQAKWQNTMRQMQLINSRLHFIRSQGLEAGKNFAGIKLDDVPSLMDLRGEEIEQQLLAQGMDQAQAEQQAAQQLRQEFGL